MFGKKKTQEEIQPRKKLLRIIFDPDADQNQKTEDYKDGVQIVARATPANISNFSAYFNQEQKLQLMGTLKRSGRTYNTSEKTIIDIGTPET